MIKTTPLKSDLLDTVTYDSDREVLRLRFKSNGAEYEYRPRPDVVPPDDMHLMYISIINCESAGKFFIQHIKGKLPFRKLEPEEREASA